MLNFYNKISYYIAYILLYAVFMCAIYMVFYLFSSTEYTPPGIDLVYSTILYVIAQSLIARRNCRWGFIVPVIIATLSYMMVGDINGEDIPFTILYDLAPPLFLMIERLQNIVSNPIWLFHATYLIAILGLMFYLYGIHILFNTIFGRIATCLIARRRYFRGWVYCCRKKMKTKSRFIPHVVSWYPFTIFLGILLLINSIDIFHYIRKVLLLGTSNHVITATLVDIQKHRLHSYGVFQYEWEGLSYTTTSSFPDDILLGLEKGDEIEIYISTQHPEYMDVKYWYHF